MKKINLKEEIKDLVCEEIGEKFYSKTNKIGNFFSNLLKFILF